MASGKNGSMLCEEIPTPAISIKPTAELHPDINLKTKLPPPGGTKKNLSLVMPEAGNPKLSSLRSILEGKDEDDIETPTITVVNGEAVLDAGESAPAKVVKEKVVRKFGIENPHNFFTDVDINVVSDTPDPLECGSVWSEQTQDGFSNIDSPYYFGLLSPLDSGTDSDSNEFSIDQLSDWSDSPPVSECDSASQTSACYRDLSHDVNDSLDGYMQGPPHCWQNTMTYGIHPSGSDGLPLDHPLGLAPSPQQAPLPVNRFDRFEGMTSGLPSLPLAECHVNSMCNSSRLGTRRKSSASSQEQPAKHQCVSRNRNFSRLGENYHTSPAAGSTDYSSTFTYTNCSSKRLGMSGLTCLDLNPDSPKNHRSQRFLRTHSVLESSGLLTITMKTAEIIKSNKDVEQEIQNLKAQTRDFLKSVLNNDQNDRIRDFLLQKKQEREASQNRR